ncbi:MAG TPA: membrane protein insertase YidC [Chitinophagaceae bacterium]|nr:membrane protein insertase YidC [Chitinophagaceae bacterium]
MQSMDKNTVIGFVLLAILLFAYMFISTKNSRELEVQKKRYDDSVAIVKARAQAAAAQKDTAKLVTNIDSVAAGLFSGQEKTVAVENEVLSIVFTNKGGQAKSVRLKKYKSVDSTQVELQNDATDYIAYSINTTDAAKRSAYTSELFFKEGQLEKKADGSQSISFTAEVAPGETIVHQYVIHPDSYLVDWNVQLTGADKLLTQNSFNLQWHVQAVAHEKIAKYERQQSQIIYFEGSGYDYNTLLNKTEKKFEKPVQWVSVKQQFFNTTLIAKDKFDAGQIQWTHHTEDTSRLITQASASFNKKLAGNNITVPMQVYYGPNDYKILRNSGVEDMDKIINLGQGMYAFVRPINQFIIMPVFNFFKSFISSYGLVIALLTIFIRLVTSPLVYTSYLSGAKMKALRPELDVLKKKFPDQQQFGMEQMKLFREVGVNPLGGCIPALLQIPIFFALYSLFNSSLALRGEHFLWAKDLSTFDVIAKLPFSIPAFGDHISLFTITAVATSFLISVYNMNMTPDQSNPALKYMPYIFPFVLLFIFNSLPAALTWYYTVSNLITLILQWVIQNYIIDHNKILLKLEENKKKPKTKSKWQERLEQMQDTQKRVQEMKTKPKGK